MDERKTNTTIFQTSLEEIYRHLHPKGFKEEEMRPLVGQPPFIILSNIKVLLKEYQAIKKLIPDISNHQFIRILAVNGGGKTLIDLKECWDFLHKKNFGLNQVIIWCSQSGGGKTLRAVVDHFDRLTLMFNCTCEQISNIANNHPAAKKLEFIVEKFTHLAQLGYTPNQLNKIMEIIQHDGYLIICHRLNALTANIEPKENKEERTVSLTTKLTSSTKRKMLSSMSPTFTSQENSEQPLLTAAKRNRQSSTLPSLTFWQNSPTESPRQPEALADTNLTNLACTLATLEDINSFYLQVNSIALLQALCAESQTRINQQQSEIDTLRQSILCQLEQSEETIIDELKTAKYNSL